MYGVYYRCMKTEAEFKATYENFSKEQVVDALYQLQLKCNRLEEVNANLARMHFGKKSEKVSDRQLRLDLFNEAEETVEESKPEDLKEPEITIPEHKRKKAKRKSEKDLPIKVVEESYPESTDCPRCGKEMKELKTIYHDYLIYRKAELYIERHIEHQYFCENCSKETDSLELVKPDMSHLPARVFQGSRVTESLLAHIAYEKILMCVPFYRQAKDYQYGNVNLSRQVLCNWFIQGAKQYLEFVFHKMEEDFRKVKVGHGDETTLTCLENQDERNNSYVWLLMSGRLEEIQMALYYYNDTREHAFINEIIPADWGGIFHSDGYEAYQNCKGISLLCGCWAHARRKVFEALTSNTESWKAFNSKKATREQKEEILKQSPRLRYSSQLINEIDKLFSIEKKLKDKNATVEDTFNVRQEQVPAIFEEIRNQCLYIKDNFTPESKLVKAANYILNNWEYLTNYIKDGRTEISNNRCERDGIKPYVMSRKNFLFSATRDGAKYSCMYFSLIISAVMNHLNPEAYLAYVFHELANYGLRDDVIERVLPYSKSIPDNLRVNK